MARGQRERSEDPKPDPKLWQDALRILPPALHKNSPGPSSSQHQSDVKHLNIYIEEESLGFRV